MDELPTETQEQVIGALGRAIVKLWSQLPHDFQQHLFEEAVRSEAGMGEPPRSAARAARPAHPQGRCAGWQYGEGCARSRDGSTIRF
jgi:hypothetical protein